MAPVFRHVSSHFKDLPSQMAPRDLTLPIMPLTLEKAATTYPSTRIENESNTDTQPRPALVLSRAESNNNPFSGSSPKVTAATIGGFVGAFVVVLALAAGLFIWLRKRAKRRRESYSRITSMPWDRSPLFMVAPYQNQQHDSLRGISSHHSFPAMEITHNVPRLLPPPRPPPPASRDTVQLRHKSSGLILPPRPELEDSQVVEKDPRGLKTTAITDSREEVFRPENTPHRDVDYMHYHQHARFNLSPAVNPRLIRKNIDGLFPDSPTLALTPVHARYAHKHPSQRPPDSPTSTYSNEGAENDSDKDLSGSTEEDQAIFQTAKQVYINSPTSAHTATLPREFHKSTRYLYPHVPSAPPTPPMPRQVHVSSAYLYAADGSGTSTHANAHATRAPEEKRNKLRKQPPNSPATSPAPISPRPQMPTIGSRAGSRTIDMGTPAIPSKDTRRAMHMSTPPVPSQHAPKSTSMQELRPRAVSTALVEPSVTTPYAPPKAPKEVPVVHLNARRPNPLAVRPSTVTFESTTPLEMLSSATYKGPSSLRQDRRGVRPRTVTFESTPTIPPAVASRPPQKSTSPPRPSPLGVRPRTVTFEPTVVQISQAPQAGVDLHNPDPKPLGLRPRTVAFGPTTSTAAAVLHHASQPGTTDPPRPQSLGPGPTLIIPSQNNFVQEVPKLDTAVVRRSPTKYQYPTSPRLTRRSTSHLNNTGTLPPRTRQYPYRSSSLNPNSHIINSSDNNLVNRNGNHNFSYNNNSNHNLNQSPTSPISAATADSKDIPDIRSTKYLSSEFAATHGTRRQAQRAMTASPTIMSRSVQNAFGNYSPTETDANTLDADKTTTPRPSFRQKSPSPTRITSTAGPSRNEAEPEPEPERERQPGARTAGAASSPTTPTTYGTAIVTTTISYSSSQRRGQHHSIQPPHRLMAPLSRGTNVSPRMGMGVGLGSGWI